MDGSMNFTPRYVPMELLLDLVQCWHDSKDWVWTDKCGSQAWAAAKLFVERHPGAVIGVGQSYTDLCRLLDWTYRISQRLQGK